MAKTEKTGLTFTELLVTIVLVIIIAVVLTPAFAKAREKARQTVCINNLKEIGQAFYVYVQNYGGWIPCAEAGGSTNWQVQLAESSSLRIPRPGMKNTVFYCPAKGGAWGTAGCDGSLYSYSVDRCFVGSTRTVRKYSGIVSPGKTIYAVEGGAFSFSSSEEGSLTDITGNAQIICYRHGGFANVLFYDGSVSSVNAVLKSSDFNGS